MMASPSLAIAKASLTAALIRPDPTSISRTQINEVHGLLDAVLQRCSPTNIQRCKQWILASALSSAAKAAAFAKYVVALAASIAVAGNKLDFASSAAESDKPAHRKQLYLLYLLNDLLHECKYHQTTSDTYQLFTQHAQRHLVDTFVHAASHDRNRLPRHFEKLQRLLKIWESHAYLDSNLVEMLRETINGTVQSVGDLPSSTDQPAKIAAEIPFELPTTHGDPEAPFNELPAATMLPHIVTRSKKPIDPRKMEALRFDRRRADPSLVSAVKAFMKEADIIYGMPVEHSDAVNIQLDDIGQTVYVDKTYGDVTEVESYYGWSKTFCQGMVRSGQRGGSRGHSRSRSGSHDRGHSSSKRRRSFSRDGSRSRSSSGSDSPAPRFRSQGDGGSRNFGLGRRPSRSRSHSRQRDSRGQSPGRWERGHPDSSGAIPSASESSQSVQPSLHNGPPLPFPFAGGFPMGPDGLPLPPPRPPNWSGPWPPLPPPPSNFSAGQPPFSSFNRPTHMPNRGGSHDTPWPVRPPFDDQWNGRQ